MFAVVDIPLLATETLFQRAKSPDKLAYFADGQPTNDIFRALPNCFTSSRFGTFLELYNVNTGKVFGRASLFDHTAPTGNPKLITSVALNRTLYPVLNTSLTGLYACRTNNAKSLGTYQLNVRGKKRKVIVLRDG